MRRFSCALGLLFTALALLFIACSDAKTGGVQMCDGVERPMLNCDSEVAFDGIKTKGGISIFDVAGAQGEYEDKALRQINTATENFIVGFKRLCEEYNSCVLPREKYAAESKAARERFSRVPAMQAALAAAESDEARSEILNRFYEGFVPAAARTEEIRLRFGVNAGLKKSGVITPQSSADFDFFNLEPMGPLPTGGAVLFSVEVSTDAYLYIFQVTPSRGVNVLFPDDRIGTRNPLPAGRIANIPGGADFFEVTAEDVGLEKVYIVASTKPIATLDAALNEVKSGSVATVDQSAMLMEVARVEPLGSDCKARELVLRKATNGANKGCARSRALVLRKAKSAPIDSRSSVEVMTTPGDNTIVTVFPFEHLTEADYESRMKASGTPTNKVVIE